MEGSLPGVQRYSASGIWKLLRGEAVCRVRLSWRDRRLRALRLTLRRGTNFPRSCCQAIGNLLPISVDNCLLVTLLHSWGKYLILSVVWNCGFR